MVIKYNYVHINLLCFPLITIIIILLFNIEACIATFIIDWKVITGPSIMQNDNFLLVLKVSIVLISSSPAVPSWFCHLSLHCHPLPALNDESAVLPTERPVSLHSDSAFLHG